MGRDEVIELAIAFEVDDREHNRRRFYRLQLAPDRQLPLADVGASPALVLTVQRGRIGGKAICRRERFTSVQRALERWGQLCTLRRQHGYQEQP